MLKQPPRGSIPDEPGSYLFKDADGRVIYVGKAKSLRSRVSSYFGRSLPLRTRQMTDAAASVEWIQVANEVEALMLEFSLIQRHRPRFNVRYTDDKSYPYLCVTTVDQWPRAMVMRGRRRKGNRYFGPYGHAYAIRQTLDLLLRTFPIRTCTDGKFNRHAKLGKPCLLHHIEKCAGPCVGEIGPVAYDELVDELLRFLEGDTDWVLERLRDEMQEASDRLDYERAARLRDRLTAVGKAVETQQMVGSSREDIDVVGIFDDELEAAVQVFHVRRGRVSGRRGFVVDKAEELTRPELVSRALERLYAEENPIGWPKAVLVPNPPANGDLYREWLGELRGSRVDIRVPQRGPKKDLQQTVTRNAEESFNRHRLKRTTDHNSRARALNELQHHLGLPAAPLRIECYDMSHLSGRDYVGSMVVMEDGLPKPSEYRRFKIRTVAGNDDFAAMEEVLTRRLASYLEQRGRPVAERDGRFSYPPQLLLVDGGKGQLGVAVRVLEELGLDGDIPAAALAKQFEEVFVPGCGEPVRVPRQSEALYMLQRVRDESHRFALAYHRSVRGKRMTESALDGIEGLGPVRRARLVRELGGVRAVQRAELAELEALAWLPDRVAGNVHRALHGVGTIGSQ